MDKPVIDDAMIERALSQAAFIGSDARSPYQRNWMRKALIAALTPPAPEPEVAVSEGMVEAGAAAWRNTDPPSVRVMYVAMERQRLREAGPGPEPARSGEHSRRGDGANRHHRRGPPVQPWPGAQFAHHRPYDPVDVLHAHRRSTDPK